MTIVKKIWFGSLFLALAINAAAQNTDVSIPPITQLPLVTPAYKGKLQIREIIIKGNKKTKGYMILREIQFKPGDSISISNLNESFQLAKQQVYNTALFHEVAVELAMITAFQINVIVTVKERWYIFPTPQFQPVDRSLNEWLVKYNGDLSRVNYGAKFEHYNFSGRRDPLHLYVLNGYTKNVAFSYSQPYSNNALNQGFGIGGGFSENREVAYKTSTDNKILFFTNNNFVKKSAYGNISLRLQKGILFRHLFNIAYSSLTVSDTVISAAFNPNYFNTNSNKNGLIDFSYTYQYTNANNAAYALKGVTGYLTLSKRGLGLTGGTNRLVVEAAYNKFWAHAHNWYTSLQVIGNVKLPFEQPYINQKAIGYANANLRGLEYYVIDGVAFGIFKYTLKKKLFSFSIPMPFTSSLIPSLPFSIFAKTYVDAGYCYNKKKYDTNLNNRLLYTGGFGIDILTLYDISLKIEYSFNQLGQHGLFFETR
jgi:outer membrane protein assembly factor BamA